MVLCRLLILSSLPALGVSQKPCHATSPAATDDWCNTNCNHSPPNCPPSLCSCDGPGPSPGPSPPGPSPPGPSPPGKEIKVLCYGGPGAGMDNPDIRNQIMCMKKGLVPGVTFSAHISETLHSSDLQGYDVILAPGGEIGYDRYQEFDQNAVRAFVKAGGGYYGTCAGAYAGCLRTEADPVTGLIDPDTGRKAISLGNDTNGNPIYAPELQTGLTQAICHTFWHVAPAQFSFDSHGQTILKQPAQIEIDHHNGPTMDCHGTNCEMISKFVTASPGAGAMLIDKYGSGAVILISPHPEHDKDQNCEIVARAAAFAGGAITHPLAPLTLVV